MGTYANSHIFNLFLVSVFDFEKILTVKIMVFNVVYNYLFVFHTHVL